MELILLTSTEAGSTLGEFTTFATTILDWLITTFGTILTWLVGHPIAMIGLIMSLIIMAIGTLRNLIGGSSEKKNRFHHFRNKKKMAA